MKEKKIFSPLIFYHLQDSILFFLIATYILGTICDHVKETFLGYFLGLQIRNFCLLGKYQLY